MSSWLEDEPVRVSVCCITYKQEQYIEQAIDSFLMQKTTFPFEIIIGEDCGGDRTLDILAKYKLHYPKLIKIITADENVGANSNLLRVCQEARGTYIALCEGDDYWLDAYKLQKQYEKLQQYVNINICFTPAKALTNKYLLNNIALHSPETQIYSFEEVIRGGGEFMPTASLMVRAASIKKLPNWFSDAPIGDYYLQIWCSFNCGALYIPDVTCVYRINSVGSWSTQRKKLCLDKLLNDSIKQEYILNELCAMFGLRRDFNFVISKMLYSSASILALNGFYSEARREIEQSWKYYQQLDWRQSFMYKIRRCLFVYRRLSILKGAIANLGKTRKNQSDRVSVF